MVDVDNVQHVIIVSLDADDRVEDIDPSSVKGVSTGQTAGAMSMVISMLCTSVLGDMFMSNIANVLNQTTSETDQEKTLRAIEESSSVVHDGPLLATANAQFIIANDFTGTPVVKYKQSGQIGQSTYRYAIFGVNMAVFTVAVFAGIRSKGWRGLPRFNFVNTQFVVFASSTGGAAVSEEVQGRRRNGPAGNEYVWSGDTGNVVAGDIRAMLTRNEKGLCLELFEATHQ